VGMIGCGNGDENVTGWVWGLEMGMGMEMLASAKGRRKFI